MFELVDWYNIEDIYCAGLADIEVLPGGNVRLSWHTTRKVRDETVRVLVCSLVMAAETAIAAGQCMARATTAEKERAPTISSTLN
jgi:hypothetical protein